MANYRGRIPLTAKQMVRPIVRLHASARSIALDTGVLGAQLAASAPWPLGGDSGTFTDVTAWTVGTHCDPLIVDGRRTRRQPHELRVGAFVLADGTELQVRLTQDGIPLERAQANITATLTAAGARPPALVVPVPPLEERVVTLRYEVRILGGGGARIAYVQVVPSQEAIRNE